MKNKTGSKCCESINVFLAFMPLRANHPLNDMSVNCHSLFTSVTFVGLENDQRSQRLQESKQPSAHCTDCTINIHLDEGESRMLFLHGGHLFASTLFQC